MQASDGKIFVSSITCNFFMKQSNCRLLSCINPLFNGRTVNARDSTQQRSRDFGLSIGVGAREVKRARWRWQSLARVAKRQWAQITSVRPTRRKGVSSRSSHMRFRPRTIGYRLFCERAKEYSNEINGIYYKISIGCITHAIHRRGYK